jgi:DNA (cytosine-5)-methyltransferase 1
MNDIVLSPFAGPGGWAEALTELGLHDVGIELDSAACATRRAAGHSTIQADVAAFPVGQLAGKVWGQTHSPPCTTFSAAGDGAGNVITAILAAGIRDAIAGRKTRALRRRQMTHALRVSSWGGDTPAKQVSASEWRRTKQQAWKRKLLARRGSPAARCRDMAAASAGPHLTRSQRSARIWAAVRSAALVIEPARYLHAAPPEWVALEQVPSVLPLWQVYGDELRKRGYSVWAGKLDAADYGVAQTRERAILIASRVRKVARPEPTHYDPRKGMQLWGTPWVSMAEALGWGATGRPGPAVTSGGTSTGGAEPFPTRARELLAAERDSGAWILHTNRDQRPDGSRQTADPRSAPALTAKSGGQWVLQKDTQANAAVRPAPAPAISFGHASSSMRWVFRNNNNACERSLDEPAGTLFFGHRSNWAAWVQERPATTIQGDPRVGRPGHKDRSNGGESQFAQDSVRITVEEAAVLQSFRPDYPWQGTKTKAFEQVGNAVPPLLAEHVVAMASGVSRSQMERPEAVA